MGPGVEWHGTIGQHVGLGSPGRATVDTKDDSSRRALLRKKDVIRFEDEFDNFLNESYKRKLNINTFFTSNLNKTVTPILPFYVNDSSHIVIYLMYSNITSIESISLTNCSFSFIEISIFFK